MSSYLKVKASKLSFKGGLDPKIDKKKKKKKKNRTEELPQLGREEIEDEGEMEEGAKKKEKQKKGKMEKEEDFELDQGIGHAPDGGKKTKLYEDMFPVETKRFGYETEKKKLTREEALDIRVKKKADRYCK